MEGPKLENTESSAVIHWAYTEFCSRHKRQNFNKICARFFFKKLLSACLVLCLGVCIFFFFEDTAFDIYRQVLKSVCHPSYILSKYDRFYYILSTGDSFATELSLMVNHGKPKCPVKILDCCLQGQGHSKHLEFLFFVWISSELLNHL